MIRENIRVCSLAEEALLGKWDFSSLDLGLLASFEVFFAPLALLFPLLRRRHCEMKVR
jgi:hypothetical protein